MDIWAVERANSRISISGIYGIKITDGLTIRVVRSYVDNVFDSNVLDEFFVSATKNEEGLYILTFSRK